MRRASTRIWCASYLGLTQDNNIRSDTSLEKLAKLRPAFDASGAGTLTAGNSTPMTDGASAVLLASEAWARERNLPVLAFLTYGKVAAVDFVDKKEGLLMAPAYAVPRMLEDAQLTLQDFDFYEIHEAFAGQVLCTLKAWSDPAFCREKLGAAGRSRRDRSCQAQRQGRQPRDRPPVRRDRHAHRRDAGEDSRREPRPGAA